jgi:hypothetical protein
MLVSTDNILPKSRKVHISESLFSAELSHNRKHLAIVAVTHTGEHVVLNLDIQTTVRHNQEISANVTACLDLVLNEISFDSVVDTFFADTLKIVREEEKESKPQAAEAVLEGGEPECLSSGMVVVGDDDASDGDEGEDAVGVEERHQEWAARFRAHPVEVSRHEHVERTEAEFECPDVQVLEAVNGEPRNRLLETNKIDVQVAVANGVVTNGVMDDVVVDRPRK